MTDLLSLRAGCTLSTWTGVAECCQWCGSAIPEGRRRTWCSDRCRVQFERNHVWRKARAAARKRDKYICVRCGKHKSQAAIEVNHIVPLAGVRPNVSCSHHLAGLETLCHDCHVAVTATQRASGLLRRGTNAPG